MITRSACILGMVLLSLSSAFAQTLPWQQFARIGDASLKFLLWPVYEAVLYSPTETFDLTAGKPFALSLTYQRAFSSQQLVAETQRQWEALEVNTLASWVTRLEELLPDVSKQDTLTLYVDGSTSTFFLNNYRLGTIDDAAFSKSFAAIWLSEDTTRPLFRQQLLGIDQ